MFARSSKPAALVACALALASLFPALSAGCASDGPECTRGSDCATGACNASGRCVPSLEADAATDSSVVTDASTGTDATSNPDVAPPPIDGGCLPNKDFVITRAEVPLQAGLRATYKTARNATISTAGTPGAGDTRVWDFSADLPGDALTLVETQKLDDKWYKDDFKTATYVTKLSESSTLLGVFEVAPSALKLQGVVSPDNGVTKTNVAYSPSVDVLAFPLEMGKTFTTTATVSGTVSGFFSTYSEKYESKVDAKGTLKTPLGTFTVLRVQTLLTKTVGVLVTTTRTFAWVTECYGTVATASSKDNEANVEFTQSAEVRRIAP
jgi:hypothetical protein